MIHISMCRRGADWSNHPCDFPIIGLGTVSLGQLIHHSAHRYPSNAVWTVETIGL
jgi:hypothetical protein